jgi:tyrosyl-tRNA synthetase
MELKKRLGREVVAAFHDAGAATQAQEEFERIFQQRQAPSGVPELAAGASTDGVISADDAGVTVDVTRFVVTAGFAPSRSEARRLLAQGAIELDGQLVSDGTAAIAFGAVLKVGRRRFLRVVKG